MSDLGRKFHALLGGVGASAAANLVAPGIPATVGILLTYVLTGGQSDRPPTDAQMRQFNRWLLRIWKDNKDIQRELADILSLDQEGRLRLEEVRTLALEIIRGQDDARSLAKGIAEHQTALGRFSVESHNRIESLVLEIVRIVSPESKVLEGVQELGDFDKVSNEAKDIASEIRDVISEIHRDYYSMFADLRDRLEDEPISRNLVRWFERRRQETVVLRTEVQMIVSCGSVFEHPDMSVPDPISEFLEAVRLYFGASDGMSRASGTARIAEAVAALTCEPSELAKRYYGQDSRSPLHASEDIVDRMNILADKSPSEVARRGADIASRPSYFRILKYLGMIRAERDDQGRLVARTGHSLQELESMSEPDLQRILYELVIERVSSDEIEEVRRGANEAHKARASDADKLEWMDLDRLRLRLRDFADRQCAELDARMADVLKAFVRIQRGTRPGDS